MRKKFKAVKIDVLSNKIKKYHNHKMRETWFKMVFVVQAACPDSLEFCMEHLLWEIGLSTNMLPWTISKFGPKSLWGFCSKIYQSLECQTLRGIFFFLLSVTIRHFTGNSWRMAQITVLKGTFVSWGIWATHFFSSAAFGLGITVMSTFQSPEDLILPLF